MNGTPRLRSAFPSTPSSTQKQNGQSSSTSGSSASSSKLTSQGVGADPDSPLIPIRILDAPSQRLYVAFLYLGLTAWRFYDFFQVLSDDADSLWSFLKWVFIDSTVLYGLPGLKIPWLQWSPSTMTLLFVTHATINAIMMFRIPIPLQAWLIALTRLLYDRELAVLERNVKPASILHNASLILGKQIIHILPEGSAILNPDQSSFCLGDSKEPIMLPIRINQTAPTLIEMLRIDPETNANETIVVVGKDLAKYRKEADKEHGKAATTSPRTLKIPIKATGLYRLTKVVDKSDLEVQRSVSDTLVVQCPSAFIEIVGPDRCKGDLTNFHLRVEGTPPMKLKYSKTVNGKDTGHHVLEYIFQEDLLSPLTRQRTSGTLVTLDSSSTVDISWARRQSVRVPINESLGTGGDYKYSIDEVADACGNSITFSSSHPETSRTPKPTHGGALEQVLKVHERPRVAFRGCDAQHELKVEKGKPLELPIRITSTGPEILGNTRHSISYLFTPVDAIQESQNHGSDAIIKQVPTYPGSRGPLVAEPGLYSLGSVSSDFCAGEVLEPSACLLTNPPEPNVEISHDIIPGKCAGKPIGLSVNLELTGTPPFRVFYSVSHDGGKLTPKFEEIDRIHSQIELRPHVAGHYSYSFTHISDSVYKNPRTIYGEGLKFEQEIKPPASARVANAPAHRKVCIDEPVSFTVDLIGDGPLILEYELVHSGGRRKQQKGTIQGDGGKAYIIDTERLEDGGEYTFALLSVTEQSGCKNPLSAEVKLDVSLQKPRASFGLIDNKRTITALESKRVRLPIRLQGSLPWYISYRNLKFPDIVLDAVLNDRNGELEVKEAGIYEIIDVHDAACPGNVDNAAKEFEVQWIQRPAIHISQGATMNLVDGTYVKRDVCEGDEDSAEITFTGIAPFHVSYEQRTKPNRGSHSISSRTINAGLNSAVLKMETSNAGVYEYEFLKLGDYSYSHDSRKFTPVTVQQRVLPNPSARFINAGKTYKYCKEDDSGDEVIPIALTGAPPFHLEIEIKHHSITKPELVNVPHVESDQYNFHIPHRVLAIGTHAVSIRKVTDSRGCQRHVDYNAPNVRVSVADVPTISPLESKIDYCVGDRISYTLSGMLPFNVFYNFQGHGRKASISTTSFRRLAEQPGEFVITGISDQRSTDACKAKVEITKYIHEMPSVRVSKGKVATAEIHEGGNTEILFEFGGTPPFEFTYTRSTHVPKGKKSEVLETKSEISHEYVKTIRASDEGVYEVVAIKDKYCSFSTQRTQGKSSQKLLTYR